ncbi:MAG TPA: ATP synthase F0 subunit B [Thermodesulfovibrionales bacterium]|nr:ATP synthase F0 subunit B [Thermodesulfovibrionales bacterium]
MIVNQLSAIREKSGEKASLPIGYWSLLLLSFCIFHFALITLAFGAEEAAHGGEWKEWLWKILNFAILVGILVWFAKKPLIEFLKKRTELIEKTLQEAKQARELAEKALAEVEERLKLKDREIEEIIAHAQQSARTEKDLLVQQGEQMKEKILEQAKNNIDYEVRLAKDSIKAEAVEIALELAEKKLKEKLTREEQIRLIEESLAKMGTKN